MSLQRIAQRLPLTERDRHLVSRRASVNAEAVTLRRPWGRFSLVEQSASTVVVLHQRRWSDLYVHDLVMGTRWSICILTTLVVLALMCAPMRPSLARAWVTLAGLNLLVQMTGLQALAALTKGSDEDTTIHDLDLAATLLADDQRIEDLRATGMPWPAVLDNLRTDRPEHPEHPDH